MAHKISVVTNREQFNSLFNEFRDSAKISENPHIFFIGLDIEYICKDNNPTSFSKCLSWVKNADNKIAVCKIQLATNTMAMVIDLCKFERDLPQNLIKILISDSWIKTGIGISNDLSYLSINFDLGQCNGGIDLKIIAQLRGCQSPNLFDLYQSVADFKYTDFVEKHKKKSGLDGRIDWSMDMTFEQIEYASMDAIMSYKVGKYFIDAIMTVTQLGKMGGMIQLRSSSESSSESSTPPPLPSVPPPPLPSIVTESKEILVIPTPQMIITTMVTNKNYIGMLQEYGQKNAKGFPEYKDHIYTGGYYPFTVSCTFLGKTVSGQGMTKKEAKTNAAKNMLEKL